MSLTRDRKDVIVVVILLSHGIYMEERNGTLDLDLVRHLSEAQIARVLPMSIEDHPLLWMVIRS